MAIKLSECSPSLHAAIMAQLAREGRAFPSTTITYAVATYKGRRWEVGPECSNKRLVQGIASRLQLQTGATARMAMIGKPLAVCLEITRTTAAKEPQT